MTATSPYLYKSIESPELRWLEILQTEDVQTVILNRYEDAALLRLLQRSRDWAVDFANLRSVIFVRAS